MEFRERSEAYAKGLLLLGNLVRFTGSETSIGRRCTNVRKDGTVELEGLRGRFSPYVLEIDGEIEAVPVLGWVN